ncbi:hypothetical protein ABIF38_006387 [Bradyrhizobium japonicum]|uniref:hypothetical protein n=1 Tax=Bradyrhizobium elkanii TaxID=29448 RepID=UPI000365EE6B|nr:hypothetical protein [Bradyrhizobium elkanii]WAX24318.1 hypothetical protein [Bradyrhizobium phage ppBeUSDA76-1]MCP1731305.1 hypothetical protein [Bradyrhizobium elkanii]MCS3575434.1 hypothetical protein [Bradyrhizobium elkanii]MCS3591875.1 hypothetical protein [Bradyrhizobium elkanii]MCS3621320.1 hypothetical protein [Bradyrhizobium elkanii]
MSLALRPIGIRDYSIIEDGQRIGRIRYASERSPGVWLWHVQVHITGGLPVGSAGNLEAAKAEFKSAWSAFKARQTPEKLAAAYAAMNIRKS